MTEKQRQALLKKFINEFFDFDELLQVGFFTEEMRTDYNAQAKKICSFFGLKSIYEYGARKTVCHISWQETENKPFITVIENIYE